MTRIKHNTAMPPRHRENLSSSRKARGNVRPCLHNAYPGGKTYRKAMARLKLRAEGQQDGKAPDKARSHKKPGSMTKR